MAARFALLDMLFPHKLRLVHSEGIINMNFLKNIISKKLGVYQ